MGIIILYILIIFIIYFCYLKLNIRENLENDDAYKKYFGRCVGPNCAKSEIVKKNDCIGGWLPWSDEKVDPSTREIRNQCRKTSELDYPVYYRSYKVLNPAREDGLDCLYSDNEMQDIDCNLPKPDDCLEIRARYYGKENPSIEEMKEKCEMKNCIPATKLTSSCDSNIIEEGVGINKSVKKRCPWICDPMLALNGDGINSCQYDYHCSKCSPKKIIDDTNCGEAIQCPNSNSSDGCGYFAQKKTDIASATLPNFNSITPNEYPIIKAIPDYKKYVDNDGDVFFANNYYDKIKIDKPDIYKASSCYYPYNSMYEL